MCGTIMLDIVNALLMRHGSVLLARRSPNRNTYPDLWSFPGGHVEETETLGEALGRELREEIGITPTTFTYLGPISDPDFDAPNQATYHMFAITAWKGGEPTMLGDEHTAIAWFTLEAAIALPDLALDDYRTLFRRLAAG
jgi:8-oxo-dGTP diphosphatase